MFKVIKLAVLMTLLQSFAVNANLLISPMRVALNDRERSAQIILINSGDVIRSYRIGWTEKEALPDGGYKNLTAQESKNFPIASPMFRISPKQVTLAPGARQIIKIAARRPKGLADGEYRSHLQFTALPPKIEVTDADKGRIKMNIFLNYSIPIILRQGPLQFAATIDDAVIIPSIVNNKKRYDIEVSMSRTGRNSTFGTIFAYWQPNGSNEEIQVGLLNSVKIYPEINKTKYQIFWQPQDIMPVAGRLRVVYQGKKEFNGKVLGEKTLSL